MTILIVDDDQEDGIIFCEAANEVVAGVKCVVRNSGQEALGYLRSGSDKPDYIFLDIRMNIMDGKECLLKIKSIKEVYGTPVIIYSAADISDQERLVYRKLGAKQFLTKTDTLDELVAHLRAILK